MQKTIKATSHVSTNTPKEILKDNNSQQTQTN
jgi:hypothetical protein